MKLSINLLEESVIYLDTLLFNNTIMDSSIELDISLNKSKKYMGLFIGFESDTNPCADIIISRKRVKTYKELIETLAHEMLHCIQYLKGKRINHGKYFKSECRRIKKEYGLDIK